MGAKKRNKNKNRKSVGSPDKLASPKAAGVEPVQKFEEDELGE